MTPNLKSRLWTAVGDAVFTIIGLLVARYLAPDMQEMIQAILIAVQPVVAVLIVAFTVESAVSAYVRLRREIAFGQKASEPLQGRTFPH